MTNIDLFIVLLHHLLEPGLELVQGADYALTVSLHTLAVHY